MEMMSGGGFVDMFVFPPHPLRLPTEIDQPALDTLPSLGYNRETGGCPVRQRLETPL
jgi:hypothetical protein